MGVVISVWFLCLCLEFRTLYRWPTVHWQGPSALKQHNNDTKRYFSIFSSFVKATHIKPQNLDIPQMWHSLFWLLKVTGDSFNSFIHSIPEFWKASVGCFGGTQNIWHWQPVLGIKLDGIELSKFKFKWNSGILNICFSKVCVHMNVVV